MTVQTKVKAIEVVDTSDDSAPDSPYHCVIELIDGDISSAIECANEYLGDYGVLAPLMNLKRESEKQFSFLTFGTVCTGDIFSCESDPNLERAKCRQANIERNTKEAFGYRACVALSSPRNYSPWGGQLKTYQSYKHDIVDSEGAYIERYDLCHIKDSDKIYYVKSISVEDRKVDVYDCTTRLGDISYLSTVDSTDVTLIRPAEDVNKVLNTLKSLRQVFINLGHCHQLDLVNFIEHLIIGKSLPAGVALGEITKRMLMLVGVTKTTVNAGIEYPPLSHLSVCSKLAKVATLFDSLDAKAKLKLPITDEDACLKCDFITVINANSYLTDTFDNLWHKC